LDVGALKLLKSASVRPAETLDIVGQMACKFVDPERVFI